VLHAEQWGAGSDWERVGADPIVGDVGTHPWDRTQLMGLDWQQRQLLHSKSRGFMTFS